MRSSRTTDLDTDQGLRVDGRRLTQTERAFLRTVGVAPAFDRGLCLVLPLLDCFTDHQVATANSFIRAGYLPSEAVVMAAQGRRPRAEGSYPV
jgi:hypothetical protein